MQPARPASPPVVRRSSAMALLRSSLLGAPRRAGQRVLVRRVVLPAVPVASWVQRALVTAALAATTATAVVLLGLVAGAVSESRGAPAPVAGPAAVRSGDAITVTVGSDGTVWEVAEAVLPSATGPELGALAERIIADNDLSTVRVQAGQTLRVTIG
ncbi:hypothetical protein [Pseudonocardia lacus]|uniref:hypothetical protein n=1 Tax=Pseudonocardia lacus TaxID=2835865 RepID=UPI001BDD32D0|nr:hypothetical protein [Pseudonocardia lacus]